MTTYSVHLPAEAAPGSPAGLERAVLVKEGFHWLALFFPLIWLLANRLWIAFLALLALTVALVFVGRAAGLGDGAIGVLDVMLGLFVAISASDLKTWGLARRGYALRDVVTGASRDEAERRFFDRWLSRATEVPTRLGGSPGPAPSQAARPQQQPQVLGLFPDAGSAR
jgi:hypothetical protein